MMKRTLRKAILVCLACILSAGTFLPTTYAAEISVFYAGKPLSLDQPPFIENSRTLVPFRGIFEAIGLDVEWDAKTRTVTGKNNDTTIKLIIDNPAASVNGKAVKLDTPATIVNDRTMVPVRFVAEASGLKVNWDQVNRRVIIGREAPQGDVVLYSSDKVANVHFLSATIATGEFTGYRELHGYPGEDRFGVYFTLASDGNRISGEAVHTDRRNLNPAESIDWVYNEKTYTNTRLEIYNFLNNPTSLAQMLNLKVSTLTADWMQKTFDKTYAEWQEERVFAEDAYRLAEAFVGFESN